MYYDVVASLYTTQ